MLITKLDTTELDALVVEVDTQKGEVIKTVAFDIEGQAKMGAPVLTGLLRNSIEAQEQDADTWRVNVWAEYGAFVELGTYKMAAQPYLVPAVERSMGVYVDAWKRLFI